MSSNHVNLSQDEVALVDQTAPEALSRMDEQSLTDLQSRLRKVRDKNFVVCHEHGTVLT